MKRHGQNALSNIELEVTPLSQNAEGKLLGGFIGMQGAEEAAGTNNPCTNNHCNNSGCSNGACENSPCDNNNCKIITETPEPTQTPTPTPTPITVIVTVTIVKPGTTLNFF